MIDLPDPDWYLDNVLAFAEPGLSGLVAPGPVALWRSWWKERADEVGAPANQQGLILTARQLPLLGLSRQTARTRVRRGVWTAAGHGAVAPLDVSDPDPHVVTRRGHALACGAALARRPGQAVRCRSAAILHGLPTYEVPGRPELGRQRVDADVVDWFGVRVSAPALTLLELATGDRRDAIMAADAALRECLVTEADIERILIEARRRPGVRQARAVLALATSKAESPLESLVRLALHDDGFPAPDLQVTIPGTRYRVDMLWRDARLILEVDGMAKYTDAERRREKRREQHLRRLGYRVERVTWDDLVRNWPPTRAWLRSALGLASRNAH